MSLIYEGEPAPNPEWERAALLSDLDEAYKQNIRLAVVHMHDHTDNGEGVGASAVLAGLVGRSPYANANYTSLTDPTDYELIMLVYAGLQDRTLRRALFMLNPPLSRFGQYDLYAATDGVDQRTARIDARLRDALARTRFDIHRSLEARDRLIGAKVLHKYQDGIV